MGDEAQAQSSPVIAVVIPCYRVTGKVLGVIGQIGDEVSQIFVIDDACPDKSGEMVQAQCSDPRVRVHFHDKNQGVGGATLTGYECALEAGADIIVKIDGDGQMDPGLIPLFVRPIIQGRADYAKGNRFYNLEGLSDMPKLRLLGNLALSFASKMSSGYWKIFDPTNGYTAIQAKVARILPLARIDRGYFFESDMLFRLNISRAVVNDVPMRAIYGDEKSGLKIARIFFPFMIKHWSNLARRIFYSYFLRDFSIASIELVLGILLVGFGTIFGGVEWYHYGTAGIPAPGGVIILAALPFLVGSQLLISFLNYDVHNQPATPLHLNL